jgi:hypothetical protein
MLAVFEQIIEFFLRKRLTEGARSKEQGTKNKEQGARSIEVSIV